MPRKKHAICLMPVLALVLAGCAFVNISLFPRVQPFEEQVVGGGGKPKILMVDVSGFLSHKEAPKSPFSDKASMPARIREELEKASQDKDIAGLVLRIDTPGGTITASDLIHHEVAEFKARTGLPVYATIVGLGTSGGYYVASAADRIYAHPTAVTGSIGVITLKFNIEGLMKKIGVESKAVTSGDLKDFFSVLRPSTPEEMEIMQAIIDSFHDRFLDVVVEGRKGVLDRKQIVALADGRPYTAGQALDAGLIDGIGYLDETLGEMKDALGLTEAKVITYVRPGAYKSNIYSAGRGDSPLAVNLINIDAESLMGLSGVEFMYLWMP